MAFSISPSTLESALAGEGIALHDLVEELTPHIEKQLSRYPVTDEDRRDLVQATLMQVVRRLDSFRGSSSFSTWLFRVTANEALMMMRSHRRHRARLIEGMDLEELGTLTAANDDYSQDRGDVLAEKGQRDAEVRRALAELPDDYRDVLVAHYHLELGLHEIADRFALTESAVRSRLHRARTKLRSILEGTPVAVEFMSETVKPDAAQAAA